MKDMSEITIPETTITDEQYAVNARQLMASVMLQATKDYCKTDSAPKRNVILKDLRSSYMGFASNGTSVVVAEQLEKNVDEIRERMLKHNDDDVL